MLARLRDNWVYGGFLAALMLLALTPVLAAGWLAAVPLLASTRRAVLLWAGYAGLSAAALVLFVVATQPEAGVLRVFGNVVIVAAMVCLQRGVRSFFGVPGLLSSFSTPG